MNTPDTHISNVVSRLSSLGVYQIHGWPLNKWEKILLANNGSTVSEWIKFAELIISKKREWTFEYNRIEIQKELETFPKRLELCHMAYRYLDKSNEAV